MAISINVVDSSSIELRGPSDDTMDFVSLGKQQLSQIGTILASDSSNQRSLDLFSLRHFTNLLSEAKQLEVFAQVKNC